MANLEEASDESESVASIEAREVRQALESAGEMLTAEQSGASTQSATPMNREERALAEYRQMLADEQEQEPDSEYVGPPCEVTLITRNLNADRSAILLGPEIVWFEGLRQMLDELYRGPLRRDAPTELTQALLWCALYNNGTFEARDAKYQSTARHWFVVRDFHAIIPPTTRRGDEDYARRWRQSVAEILGSGSEMIVAVEPGKPTDAILWSAEPRTDAELRAWSSSLPSPERIDVSVYPWTPPDDALVYLPADARAVATSFRDRRNVESTPSSAVLLDTGIPALNKQFRVGALPMGARVVIGGLTGQGKTTLALHLAEAACARGWFVVWLAYDESVDEIQARRLQRRGLPLAELAKLDELDFFVWPPGEPLEDLARAAHAEADGLPVLFVIDSIQKLETRAGDGKGERERITASVDTIQALQAKYPFVMVATAEIARGSGATKGSGSIDYGATLALRVRRNGDRLTVDIPKNRHGCQEPFELALDRAAQRLLDPSAAVADEAKLKVWEQVRRTLEERGPLSRSGLEPWVVAMGDTLRAVLRERLQAGDLTHAGRKYALI
jgi:hypothetical protein